MSTFNFKVGDEITNKYWADTEEGLVTITAIGLTFFLALDYKGDETVLGKDSYDWLPYTTPKKTVRMAPAMGRGGTCDSFWISDMLYSSEEESRKGMGPLFLKWPASESMWVDVPVEE